LLEVLEVMYCVLLCMEAVEGGLCSLEVLEVSEVPEVMHCALLRMEVVEGGLSFGVSKFPLCDFLVTVRHPER
jgi:hypothetical protein